jgi:hypothetical protein
MKVVNNFLAIGFTNGSFALIPLSGKSDELMIQQKAYKDKNSFVRDIHLY